MMKIALIILAALCALVALVLIVGALLPRQHRVTRTLMLARAPKEVYAVVRDFGSAASWRSNLARVEILDPKHFREESKDGTINYEIVEEVPNTRLVTRIVDRDLGYAGSWTYDFAPVENGTRLSITEDGDVSNVFFRFMSRFVFGNTSTIDAYLNAFAAKFGESAKPR